MTDFLAEQQFSPRAEAYVQSAVHAAGEDLEALKTFAAKHSFAAALDLGCGGGHASFALAPLCTHVTAYDLSSAMLSAVTKEAAARGLINVATQQGQAEVLPFANTAFDFVTTRYSAHHWLNVPAALAEARRVLKPGAPLMVMDVIAPDVPLYDTFFQSVEMLRDPSHVRDYTVAEWQAMLTAAGFTVETTVRRRIHIDFPSWIARMQTPRVLADAIAVLMGKMPDDVKRYFAIEADGSFMMDTASLTAVKR